MHLPVCNRPNGYTSSEAETHSQGEAGGAWDDVERPEVERWRKAVAAGVGRRVNLGDTLVLSTVTEADCVVLMMKDKQGQVAAMTAEEARAERQQRTAFQQDATKAQKTQAEDEWQRRMAKWRKLNMILLGDEGLESLPTEVISMSALHSGAGR